MPDTKYQIQARNFLHHLPVCCEPAVKQTPPIANRILRPTPLDARQVFFGQSPHAFTFTAAWTPRFLHALIKNEEIPAQKAQRNEKSRKEPVGVEHESSVNQ